MPNALLLGYGLDQPSYRHRMRSLVAPLEEAGWLVRTEAFPSGRYGLRTWERRALLRWADVTVLHQIKLSGIEARLIARFARHRVFDVDDAIYVRKPRRLGDPVHDSEWRRKKFADTCRYVDMVAAGNEVLASVARASARDIAILPTSIDTAAYRATTAAASDAPTIVWIGSPENLIYLEMIRPALARLSLRYPLLKVRVICSRSGPKSRSNASCGARPPKRPRSRPPTSGSCRSPTMSGREASVPSNCCSTWRPRCRVSLRRLAPTRKRCSMVSMAFMPAAWRSGSKAWRA
jgi:hypothetical protein